jgi:hypothetical protein
MRRIMLLLVSATVGLILGSGVALAVVTFVSGGTIEQVRIAREDNAQTTSSPSFVNIPNTQVEVVVPTGTTRLVMARFSAESVCWGSAGGWCSIRIVAQNNATGAITELQPASGDDFAFDSPNQNTETNASWESHSMDRSIRLGAGTYTIRAQWAFVGASPGLSNFRIDDYSLTVERAR